MWKIWALLFFPVYGAALAAESAFTVLGWGANDSGQINVPASVRQTVGIAAGDGHVLAVTLDGTFQAWGRNDAGQTVVPASLAPPAVPPFSRPTLLVAAGPRHSLAARGALAVSWGAVTAVPDSGGGVFRALAAGGDFNLGLRVTGGVAVAGVVAAGGNAFGQTTVPPSAQAGVSAIAAGEAHALALRDDGTVVAWGRNDFGQTAVPAALGGRAVAIAAAADFSAAVRSDGVVIVWGRGAEGPLTPPAAAAGATEIKAGRDFLIAQTERGLVVWGGPRAPTAPPETGLAASAWAGGDGFAVAVRAPFFTRTPGVVHVAAGAAAELSVDVSDETGAVFEWPRIFFGTAEGKTLRFPAAPENAFGNYALSVTYPTGFVLKTAGMLVVDVKPSIRQQPPVATSGRVNGSVQLAVLAEGSEPLRYQWRREGVDLPGTNTAALQLSPLSPAAAGRYTCVVSNAVGVVESTAVQVTVLPVGWQSGPVVAGETVTLQLEGPNVPRPFTHVVWSKDGVALPGASSEALTITRFKASDAGRYSVTFTDGSGQEVRGESYVLSLVYSRKTGTGWLVPGLAIVEKIGEVVPVRLVGVGDGGGLNYRWQITDYSTNPAPVEGINLLAGTMKGSNQSFGRGQLTVHTDYPNPGGQVLEANVAWSGGRNPADPLLTKSGPEELKIGERGEFAITIKPTVGRFAWKKDGVALPSQTTAQLTIAAARYEDAGTYEVTAEADTGIARQSWTLAIVGPPRIVRQPQDTVLGADGTAELTVELDSRRHPREAVIQGFRWYRDGQMFLSPLRDTGKTLVTSVPGAYKLRIYHESGVLDSEVAVVKGTAGESDLLQPGFYFPGSLGSLAVYVRPDRTVAMAATSGGLGWFGDAKFDGQGAFALSPALRYTGGGTPLADAPGLVANGRFSGTMRWTLGPWIGQTTSVSLQTGQPNARTGLYRGTVPGRREGEAWMFVAPGGRIALFMHDGFTITSGEAQLRPTDGGYDVYLNGLEGGIADERRSSLVFDEANNRATITVVAREAGNRVLGRYVLERESAPGDARLANLSVRAEAGAGDQTLIAGLVVAGAGTRSLLVRAVGPELARFGVEGVLANPAVQLFRGETLVAENDDWSAGGAGLAAAFGRVGAFQLLAGGKDAALLADLTAGAYTAQVKVLPGAASGIALMEIYEDGGAASAKLKNLSMRGLIRSGGAVIVGFAVGGTTPKKVLVRAIGPTLATFGVAGVLSDPRLVVMRGDTPVAANDNWGDVQAATGTLVAAARGVGAFSLPLSSRDAAALPTLAPGAYTAVIEGVGTVSGIVLVEVYEVP